MKTALYDVLVDGVIVYVGISNKPTNIDILVPRRSGAKARFDREFAA